MKVIVTPLSGFCPGVKIAEKKLFAEREKGAHLSIIGKLIHNSEYIRYLSDNGIATVPDSRTIPDGDTVVIRTHGMKRQEEAEIRKGHTVVDLTCFKVKALQNEIRKHADDGAFIIITGKSDHPEVQGLVSYADDCRVISHEDELAAIAENACSGLIADIRSRGYSKLFLCSQTTASRKLFNAAREILERYCAGALEVRSTDSICSITDERECRALEIQKEVDLTVVLGDRESSNAKKLYKLLHEQDERTVFVSDLRELEAMGLDFSAIRVVQLVSSSSTPRFLEDEVKNYLENL